MTPAARSSTAAASLPGNDDVLLVGLDEGLCGVVAQAAAAAAPGLCLHRADNPFAALGQLGARPPAGLVIAGLGDLSADEAGSVAGAMRRLAPSARLVLVAGAGRQAAAEAALRAGFDHCLYEPVTAAALVEAAGWPTQVADRQEARAQHGSEAVSAGAAALSGADLFAADPTPPALVPDDELGDVDLVNQLLRDRRGLRELALRLVRGRMRAPGLDLAATRDQVPPGHAAVPVEHQRRALGYLHAPPPIQPRDLHSWAGWLGCWLALDGHLENLWHMALRDELTGAWNRRYFERFLKAILGRASTQRFRVTLMVFDIDGFKNYNDRFGHAAGDDILRETARLMQSVVREHDVVARIGGDEFAVIFWDAEGPRKPDSEHPHDVRQAAERFQRAVRTHKFPKLGSQAPATLTISGGLAGFPWDGRTPDELLDRADQMALRSKQQGKNALTFGPGALRQG